MLWPLPSIAYPPEQAGFWSPVTSTLNWCEEDYYATIYSAEVVNALTNLLFMWLGIRGILSCRRNQHDQVFLVALCGYLLVGTGSFLFHSTLKYPMQLVDELSMIYTTCLMCYASFSYSRPVIVRVVLAVALTAMSVFITLYYHYIQDPLFHQNAYAILTTVVVLRSMHTMEVTLRPKWRHSTERDRLEREKKGLPVPTKERQQYENDRDTQTLKTMWIMVGYGLSMFLGGFLLWNLDNGFCSKLRRWRREVGLPWGIVLEGHGWWHIMTGIGAYLYIMWGIWLRHCLNKKQDEYRIHWVHLWHIPDIIRVTSDAGTDQGLSKKST
ncbi:ceramidase [Penicillium capsulatum]|uniref:Ceramidase n=1 Tax=Penicillium capsulatum TaxID=69766 RepID=A0A9W9IR69_9EURO|nr:ceramidase [Penicillium capsulatum]KAJ6129683.1 ceramidase [Penicillium capsulatum]